MRLPLVSPGEQRIGSSAIVYEINRRCKMVFLAKEIQSLNGKLAALSGFLSKGADKSLPFFKALKSCTDKKTIQWTGDAEEAFRKMKEFIEILPTLTTQSKVKVLQGAELNYPELEKLILALVHPARRLQRYFQAHPIMVLTDKPIMQVLARHEKLGRIAKWAIEREEHDIKFKERNSMKGQILAEFLAETPSVEGKDMEIKELEGTNKAPKLESTWKLYTVGLRIAADMKIKDLSIFVDSQLVASQVKGLFEARRPVIKQYLEKTKEVLGSFDSYTMEHVRRDPNKKVVALSKLASMTFSRLANEVLVEVLAEKSIVQREATDIIKEEGENWMLPIREYLLFGLLPKYPQKARKLRVRASKYRIIDENLYRKSYLSPWMRCAPRGARFLVVAIDYFTKWVEAKPLVSITGKHMEKFVWEHIVCRFGVPQIIISDNRKQFAERIFLVFCQRLGVYQSFTSVYHPQANGQVEVTNRDIIKGMEQRLGKNHQGWVDELPQVLWAHRTSPKSNNGETPFSLTYGSEAVVPIEISVETERVKEFKVRNNDKRRREDLDILEERREITFIREAHYKQKLERYYNKRV
ncbi:reverse transcriptase domain-containing protein [Tanacetum coccineum]